SQVRSSSQILCQRASIAAGSYRLSVLMFMRCASLRARATHPASRSGGERLAQAGELALVAQGGAVAEEDELRLELEQPAGGSPVRRGIGRDQVLGQAEARDAGEDVEVDEHVAGDQDA